MHDLPPDRECAVSAFAVTGNDEAAAARRVAEMQAAWDFSETTSEKDDKFEKTGDQLEEEDDDESQDEEDDSSAGPLDDDEDEDEDDDEEVAPRSDSGTRADANTGAEVYSFVERTTTRTTRTKSPVERGPSQSRGRSKHLSSPVAGKRVRRKSSPPGRKKALLLEKSRLVPGSSEKGPKRSRLQKKRSTTDDDDDDDISLEDKRLMMTQYVDDDDDDADDLDDDDEDDDDEDDDGVFGRDYLLRATLTVSGPAPPFAVKEEELQAVFNEFLPGEAPALQEAGVKALIFL